MPHSYADSPTDHSESGRISDPAEPPIPRFRAHAALALGSGVPASAPALMLTGSLAMGALVAALTVVCVGLAALMI
jgi:Zn-dependent alcohol dehydrogenase